jgi:Gpi18-like mannosyltransferase
MTIGDKVGMRRAPKFTNARMALVVVIVVLGAVTIRANFYTYQSDDYNAGFLPWYQFIAQHGGYSALKNDFTNYNVPYLYLLTTLTYLPLSPLFGIKAISVVFDFLLGFVTYRLVAIRYPNSWWPVLAGAIIIYLPTVVLNSSMWAQVDSIYTTFALGGVYFVLRRRPWLACLLFGLAFAFKLQTIFLFPALLLFALCQQIPWRALSLIPAVYLLLDIPALLVGANFSTLLKVYVVETNNFEQLTLNASTVYQYWGNFSYSTELRHFGIIATGLVAILLTVPIVAKKIELTTSQIVMGAAVSTLLVPYFLPGMHDRYFYPADTLSVVAAFYLPRKLWPLPILEQFASAFSYAPFLLGKNLVDFRILSTIMLDAVLLILCVALQEFRRSAPRKPANTKLDAPDLTDPDTVTRYSTG